jgi:segregation and condensation protein A
MLAAAPDYKVKLEAFEGPLDLLLFLVRREEVELWDIPLEKITQQFLDYLAACEEMDIHLAGDFIVMAATLIYIKSRRLLPDEPLPEGEEEDEDVLDPRHELIRRLIEYKRFKEAAAHLQTREAARLGVFVRPPTRAAADAAAQPLQLAELGVLDLLQAFNAMLRKYAARWPVADLQGARFTVADKIEYLLRAIPADATQAIDFEELFASAASREEVVVTFLALLELMRLRELRVQQSEPFASIQIFRAARPAPVATT